MNILNFSDLLAVARQQPEPQQLFFVFVRAELPEGATEEQKKTFAEGGGGALTPVICVDKSPDELTDFAALVQESEKIGQPWDLLFVSSLSGHVGIAPTTEQTEQLLQMMVQAIHSGKVASLLALDKQGATLSFY